MSPLLLQKDHSVEHMLLTLKQSLSVGALKSFLTVGGVGLAMALSKMFTSSPIQLYKIRGILRANRAPVLVHEQLSVV